mmetsp:Transcript_15263/g.41209  ORF Transcript_15263/g.41209 Transcript_15263/m.41209 type:complete len:241 (+) Transcript_15263:1024-1746(+)
MAFRPEPGHGEDLRHAVALCEGGVWELLHAALDKRGGEARPAIRDVLHGVERAVGHVLQHLVHRRTEEDVGVYLVLVDEVSPELRPSRVGVHHDRQGALEQPLQQHEAPDDPAHGDPHQVPVLLIGDLGWHRSGEGCHVAPRVHDAFGQARGAGGAEDDARLLGRHGGRIYGRIATLSHHALQGVVAFPESRQQDALAGPASWESKGSVLGLVAHDELRLVHSDHGPAILHAEVRGQGDE